MIVKTFFLSILAISFLCISVNGQANEEYEKQEIKKIINEYNLVGDNLDSEKMISFWAHKPYVARVSSTNKFYYGWDAIDTQFKKISEIFTIDSQNYSKGVTSDFNISIHGNIAYVDYRLDESGLDNGEEYTGELRLFTILEKINGTWKFVLLGYPKAKFNYPNRAGFSESEFELNNVGYNFLEEGKISDAIEVFKLNVKLYSKSPNVYDSLAEAYMKNGNDELAIKYYKKSLELNPNNTNAIKMLKKLNE